MTLKLKNQNAFQTQSFINGAWVDAPGGKTFAVTNPANGELIAEVADLDAAAINKAVEGAHAALAPWAAKTAKERAVILRRWADLVVQHADDLAAIMTAEQGKPLAEARGEVLYAASFLEWFGEEGKRAYGDVIPSPISGARILTIKQPVGVCAAITPWNFPSAMITRKAGPALGAGCTMILKPAKDTPLSALALAALAEEAGVPPGVVQVVTTSDSRMAGKVLCEHKLIRKLSFTGSTEIGKVLMKQSADTMKKLSLELGGNAPFIVFDDADLDRAVDGAIACKFRNAGQTCVCANRIYVQDSIYDAFAKAFTEKVKALKVGVGTDAGVNIGPLINTQAREKIEEFIADATDKGGKISTGGKASALGPQFFEPTVITGATPSMKVSSEEIFGPVAPLFKFKDEADVIRMANDTPYGLASYFYARDMGRVWRVAEALEYGMVAINTPILSTEVAPFGGIKESGIGREGSKYGLDEYLEIKYLLMAGI